MKSSDWIQFLELAQENRVAPPTKHDALAPH